MSNKKIPFEFVSTLFDLKVVEQIKISKGRITFFPSQCFFCSNLLDFEEMFKAVSKYRYESVIKSNVYISNCKKTGDENLIEEEKLRIKELQKRSNMFGRALEIHKKSRASNVQKLTQRQLKLIKKALLAYRQEIELEIMQSVKKDYSTTKRTIQQQKEVDDIFEVQALL